MFFFFFSLFIPAPVFNPSAFWQAHLIENEVSVLRRVKHPNIIMLVEEVDTPSQLCLVMELAKVYTFDAHY